MLWKVRVAIEDASPGIASHGGPTDEFAYLPSTALLDLGHVKLQQAVEPLDKLLSVVHSH